MTPPPNLDQLTREILHFEDQAIEHAEDAVKFKCEIGKRLIAAKELLPHGQFHPWAQKAFGWGHTHVNRHMLLARNYPRVGTLPESASLRMALAAIAEPKPPGPATAGNPRFALEMEGGQAILELKSGNVDQVEFTLRSACLTFHRILKAA